MLPDAQFVLGWHSCWRLLHVIIACESQACGACLALRLWCQRGGVPGVLCFAMQAKLVVIAQEQQAAEIREIRGDVVKVLNIRSLQLTSKRSSGVSPCSAC